MEFGSFFLFNRPADRPEAEVLAEDLDIMQAAEGLGFGSIWAAEHHFGDYGICPNAAMALASVARATKTIRLGTGVVVLPFHNPLRAAEELAFVDVLSNGRLDIGVGRGYRDKELRAFHIRHEDTRTIFRESLELMTAAWTQERVTFRGEHFDVDNVEVRPRPVQKPYPRLFIGSLSMETLGLVGELGTNLLFTPRWEHPNEADSLADYAKQIALYKDAIRSHGGDPATKEIGALRFVYCAETDEQARAEFEPPMRWFREESARQNIPVEAIPATAGEDWKKYQRGPEFDWEASVRSGQVVAGSPDTVARRLGEMQAAWGLDTLINWTRVGNLPAAKVLRSMELMGKEVLPRLAKQPAAAR